MKNIHVLPTDKPSRLAYDFYEKFYLLSEDAQFFEFQNLVQNRELYITSDEEIENCWFVNLTNNEIGYIKNNIGTQKNAKRIILTTDQDLITDGVQAIDDEFLEWFVKNPSCEFVEVESKVIKDGVWTDLKGYVELPTIHSIIHKIIIPKEEPKQENCCTPIGKIKRYVDCKGCDRKPKQETLEEASWRFNPLKKLDGEFLRDAFVKGAKWQAERMYSEEEVLKLVLTSGKLPFANDEERIQWFEQFKKK